MEYNAPFISQAKADAIQVINNLYPPDSEFKDTAKKGKVLLMQSILHHGWRKLPDEILITFADLCKQQADIEENNHVQGS